MRTIRTAFAVAALIALVAPGSAQAQPAKAAALLQVELEKTLKLYEQSIRTQVEGEQNYRTLVRAGRCERLEDRDHATVEQARAPALDSANCQHLRRMLDIDFPAGLRTVIDDLVRLSHDIGKYEAGGK